MTVSVEGLAAQVHRQAVDAAVRRIAPRLSVDAEQILDSHSFTDTVRTLDASAPDFAERIQAAIHAAASADPRFRAQAALAHADAGKPDAAEAPAQWTEADVSSARPAAVREAIAQGLLTDLGVNPGLRRRR